MAEDKKRYSIQDPQGARIFLGEKGNEHPVSVPQEKKAGTHWKSRLFQLVLLVLSAAALFFALRFTFGYIHSEKEKTQQFRALKKDLEAFSREVNLGNLSHLNYRDKFLTADSLILRTNLLLDQYPDNQSLEKSWGRIVVYRYFLDIYRRLNDTGRLDAPEPIDQILAVRLNLTSPELVDIARTAWFIVDLYRFQHNFPDTPYYLKHAPSSWDIENWLSEVKMVENTFLKHSALLKVDFPNLHGYIRMILDLMYPRLVIWDDFWDTYNKMQFADNSDTRSKYRLELITRFPNIRMLHESGNLDTYEKLRFGLMDPFFESLQGFSMDAELEQLAFAIQESLGVEVEFKKFTQSWEMIDEFKLHHIEFLIADPFYTAHLYINDLGVPLAQGGWHGRNYLKPYLLLRPGLPDVPVEKQRKLKAGFSSKTYVMDPQLLHFYFQQHGMPSDSILAQTRFFEDRDAVLKALREGEIDLTIMEDQEIHFMRKFSHNRTLLDSLKLIEMPVHRPQKVVYGRKHIPNAILASFRDALPGMKSDEVTQDNPNDHPWNRWTQYDSVAIDQYYSHYLESPRPPLNTIRVATITTGDQLSAPFLRDRMLETLAEAGYFSFVDVPTPYLFTIKNQLIDIEMNLEAEDLDQDTSLCRITAMIHKGNQTIVRRSGTFRANQDNFSEEFAVEMENLKDYLPYLARITEINSNVIKAVSTVSIEAVPDTKVKIYRLIIQGEHDINEYIANIKPLFLGEGTVLASTGNIHFILMDNALMTTRPGDFAEIVIK